MHTQHQRTRWTLLGLLICSPIVGVGVDLYAPALPAMAHFLGVSQAAIKLSISVFLFGLCLGQFCFGTLSDILGRRPLILILTALFASASLVISQSTHLDMVLIMRCIQGLSAGGISAIIRSQATDIYHGGPIKHVATYMTMVWGVGPIIAPWVGSILQHYLGWQYCFYFYAFYGVLMLIFNGCVLQESLKEKIPLNWHQMQKNYRIILTNKPFIVAMLILGASYFLLALLSILGPFLVQKAWGYSALTYGHIALIAGAGYLSGTLIYRALFRVNTQVLLIIAYIIMLAICLICFGMSFMIPKSLTLLTLPVYITAGCVGIIYPSFIAKAMTAFPEMAGTASAITGTSIFLLVAILSALVSFIHAMHLAIVLGIYLGVVVLNALIFGYYTHRLK